VTNSRANLATPVDLLVIGGGIVGAGVARDAASRGLRTLLVERADFASGTSSRSSRLLHGGLRYLAQGHLGLVWQASSEKVCLHHIAPHLCEPLPFVFPTWRGEGLPRWKLTIGVLLYDLLCFGRNLGSSASLGVVSTLRAVPGLRRAGLTGATRHFDALTNDARLVIDTLRSARSHGATLLNYAPLTAAERRGDRWVCAISDEEAGPVEVSARAVVAAGGPWAARLPHSRLKLRLTKGVHLVIDRRRLPVREAVVLSEGERILFAIPWGERIILGTTDTDFTGDPADVQTEPADIEYVLGVANRAFPDIGLTPTDAIATWAGVRPLLASGRDDAGTPSDVSRGHVVTMSEPGWFEVAGGKLTTYRLMAEQTVDAVGRHLRAGLPRSRTARLPLEAGPFSGVLPPAVMPEVVAECCRKEWARHLDDVLLRRTSWHYYHADHAAIAERAAGWMGELLGWDRDRRSAEMARYFGIVNRPVPTPAS